MIRKKGLYLGLLLVILLLIINALPIELKGNYAIFFADLFIFYTMFMIRNELFNHIALILFNITYFTFILGGCTFAILSHKKIEDYVGLSFSVDYINNACLIAFLGIAFLNTVYVIISRSTKKIVIKNFKKRTVNYLPSSETRLFVNCIFVFTCICKFLMAVEKMKYSSNLGYVSLYTRESSSLPSVVTYIGALFYFSLMMFLSMYPKKYQTYFGLLMVVIIESIILNSGDRGEPVCAILVVIVYVIHRCKKEPTFLIHKKRVALLLALLLPLAIYLLQAIKYVRLGKIMELNVINAIIEFFESQGVSFNILLFSCSYKSIIHSLTTGSYIFGQLWGYLTQNVFIRTLFHIQMIKGNTVEMAMSGYSLGSTISYIVSPFSYLNGIGAGTSYLAELFVDGSWLCIFLGTIFLALLLRRLSRMGEMSWINHAIFLNIFRCVLAMPRGEYFKWLTEAFSIPNLMLLALIYIIELAVRRKKI